MADLERDRGSLIAWAGVIGIGLLWVVMAALSLWSAARGYANDRNDWGLAWGLVGVLLLAAGLAALFGTWWHQRRVLRRDH